jgi:hypothetical protein
MSFFAFARTPSSTARNASGDSARAAFRRCSTTEWSFLMSSGSASSVSSAFLFCPSRNSSWAVSSSFCQRTRALSTPCSLSARPRVALADNPMK